jgi:inositol hexakisphosphate/diphosphoinositol-pentakisphosphate kinase
MKNISKNSFRPEKDEFDSIETKEELRSVVAIFRHGDRTPK